MDYNKTLNLPETDFPMRASLPQREPAMLDAWNELGVYKKLLKFIKCAYSLLLYHTTKKKTILKSMLITAFE